MPGYYRTALRISEAVFAAFFLASVVLLKWTVGQWEWMPILTLAVTLFCLIRMDKMSARVSFACFSVIIVAWLTWFVHMFGWAAGSPNVLVLVLSLAFFNIYVPPKGKLAISLGLIAFRIGLYAYSLNHPAAAALSHQASICFQIINSVVPLALLSIHYILFSSSIQDS